MSRRVLLILLNLAIIACIMLIGVGPILSTIMAGSIANAADCQLDEGSVHPCIINGTDYGEMLYSMGMMFWYSIFSVPVSIVLFVIYVVIRGTVFLVRALKKRKQAEHPAGSDHEDG